MAIVIHLVRHGHVENPRRVVYGRLPGFGLSAQGQAEARAVAARLAGRPVAAVYSSPMQRAQETAALIAEPFGLAVRVHDDLTEATFAAAWEGRPWWQARAKGVREWIIYRRDPQRLQAPEPLGALAARMAAAVRALARAHAGGELVAVSHGDPIKAGVLMLTGGDLSRLHDRRLPTGGVITLEVDGLNAREWPGLT